MCPCTSSFFESRMALLRDRRTPRMSVGPLPASLLNSGQPPTYLPPGRNVLPKKRRRKG
jgi:hypothetical protein